MQIKKPRLPPTARRCVRLRRVGCPLRSWIGPFWCHVGQSDKVPCLWRAGKASILVRAGLCCWLPGVPCSWSSSWRVRSSAVLPPAVVPVALCFGPVSGAGVFPVFSLTTALFWALLLPVFRSTIACVPLLLCLPALCASSCWCCCPGASGALLPAYAVFRSTLRCALLFLLVPSLSTLLPVPCLWCPLLLDCKGFCCSVRREFPCAAGSVRVPCPCSLRLFRSDLGNLVLFGAVFWGLDLVVFRFGASAVVG
jgi:hypothetical protein